MKNIGHYLRQGAPYILGVAALGLMAIFVGVVIIGAYYFVQPGETTFPQSPRPYTVVDKLGQVHHLTCSGIVHAPRKARFQCATSSMEKVYFYDIVAVYNGHHLYSIYATES